MKNIDLSNVKEYADFKRPVGGFVLEIKGVEDFPEKEYLKIQYDIVDTADPNDSEFIGMYAKRKAERDFDYPTTVVSYKSTALPMFKGFCTAIEESNNGYDFTQTYNEAELVGKIFGAVLGDEEYEGKDKNGAPKIKVRTTVVRRKSVQSIKNGDFEMPELKKFDQSKGKDNNPFAKATQTTMAIADDAENNPFAKKTEPVAITEPNDNVDDDDDIPF